MLAATLAPAVAWGAPLSPAARTLPNTGVTLPFEARWRISSDTLAKGPLWDELSTSDSSGHPVFVEVILGDGGCAEWEKRAATLKGWTMLAPPPWLPPSWHGKASLSVPDDDGAPQTAVCVDVRGGNLLALVKHRGADHAGALDDAKAVLWRIAHALDAKVPPPPAAPPLPSVTVPAAEGVTELLRVGRYRDAHALAERELAAAQKGGPAELHALVQLGTVEDALGLYQRAFEHGEKAEKVIAAFRDRPEITSMSELAAMASAAADRPLLTLLLARGYEQRQYYPAAMGLALQAHNQAKDDVIRGYAQVRYGEVRLLAGDFEGAERECSAGFDSIGFKDRTRYEVLAPAGFCLGGAKLWLNSRYTAAQYVRTLDYLQEEAPPAHPLTARAVLELGRNHASAHRHAVATRLFRRARELADYGLGPDSRIALEARLELFESAHLEGDDSEAAAALPAVEDAARTIGRDDPLLADIELAHAHHARCVQGDVARARTFAERAIAVRELALRPGAADLGHGLHTLAELDVLAGDPHEAVEHLDAGGEIIDRDQRRLIGLGSDEQRRVNLDQLATLTNQAIDLHLAHARDDDGAARVAYEAILRRKGRALTTAAEDLAEMRAGTIDSKTANDGAAMLPGLRRRFAAEQLAEARRGKSGRSLIGHNIRVAETILAMQAIVKDRPVRLPTLAAVQGVLREDSALVEVTAYRPVDEQWRHRGRARFGDVRYVAYVVLHEGPPVAVDLGDAAALDELVRKLRNAVHKGSRPIEDARGAGRALYAKLFAPIVPALRGRRTLFVSLAGELHLAPLAALVDEAGNYLVESTSITHVTTGRDLLRFTAVAPSRSDPVILGNPQFGGPATAADDDRGVVRVPGPGFAWNALPGTQAEIDGLAPLVPGARVLSGAEAADGALWELHGPKVLHLATHGFFFPAPAGDAGARGLEIADEKAPATRAAEGVDLGDRMLLSGLALAGANGLDGKSESDGWLTALEAQSLDLQGTKLVVMSACETGLGEVKNGEGVYGLRRALAIAGAETVVMSLWKVSDRGTATLMRDFYEELMAGGGRTESLRRAQLAAIASKELAHPYYWAAFFAEGDPRSLDGRWVEPKLTKQLVAPDPVPHGEGGCNCRQARAPREHSGAIAALLLLSGIAARRRQRP